MAQPLDCSQPERKVLFASVAGQLDSWRKKVLSGDEALEAIESRREGKYRVHVEKEIHPVRQDMLTTGACWPSGSAVRITTEDGRQLLD